MKLACKGSLFFDVEIDNFFLWNSYLRGYLKVYLKNESKFKELVTRNKTINFKKTPNETTQKVQINENPIFDINFREPKFHMTPLMIASLRGSRDIVVHLINHGANVSLSDIKG